MVRFARLRFAAMDVWGTERDRMQRTDRSVTILTGMIIAALYVILLVGFSRESYMRRDARWRVDARASPLALELPQPMCRLEAPRCALLRLQKP
jgi:hypothetical protein